ncbi:glycosyl transferase family 1 [Sulfolobus acidocaldarius SUSAZ]|nr:glycosyl transferase family 1 [Sulfolobus acidocaldarius SUSAZ]
MIISITPEIATDEVPIYAGGLGILEGDKYLEASKYNEKYVVLTLFYPNGHSRYYVNNEIREEVVDYSYLEENMTNEGDIEIQTRQGNVKLKVLSITRGNAKVVYFKTISPDWAVRATSRLYVDDSKFDYEYKYIILAKASEEYVKKLDNVKAVYAQESLAGLALIRLYDKYETHLVTHTPGPWGHPYFSSRTLREEFGIHVDVEDVMLTRLLLNYSNYFHTVSVKHNNLTKIMFPESNPSPFTNGVSFDRWMHEEIKKIYNTGKGSFGEARVKARNDLVSLLRKYKEIDQDKLLVVWARRMTRYKRPYFVSRLIREMGKDLNVVFVVAGKAHPRDAEGIGYMNEFNWLSKELKNVIYIHDYSLTNAKYILSGGDLLLFTPFSGWEACGTSYMKAGINGVPTLSSKDGGTLEIIKDGYNGYFFGDDIREFVDIYNSPRAKDIDNRDYVDFVNKFLYIISKAESDRDWFKNLSENTFSSFIKYCDIKRVMDKVIN